MSRLHLNKTLGFLDVFCISAGAMISSGIFILPGIAFSQIGPAVFLAYGLAGISALVGALATIELATAMPLAGGIYFYTGRSMGPLAGTVSGLLNWSAIALKSAFAIFGLSEVLFQFFDISPVLSGVILTVVFMLLNLIGTKQAAVAQVVMVCLLFLAMGLYVILGFPELKPSRFSPFFMSGKSVSSLFAEAAFVFVSFGGLLDVASVSEEVKNPRINLPRGMIWAIVAVTMIYVLTLIVTVGIMDAETLSGSLTPLASAARHYYGTPGFVLLTFGAVMAFVTTANAGIMSAARFPYAMGRDNLIPSFFSRVYGSKKMPLPALVVTGLVMIFAQFMPLEKMVAVASTVIMLSFILTNGAVIILRESGIQNYRPSFKIPFYPWLPTLSIILFGFLIAELGAGAVKLSLIIIVAGILLYFWFGRKVKLEYALLHLVHRVTKSKMPMRGLEKELREIVRGRDEIVADEVDHIIEKSKILFLYDSCSFSKLAHKLCLIAEIEEMTDALIEREKTSSTVLTSGVAIPHIVIPGENKFGLILIKCDKGIRFSPEFRNVKLAFFLYCSADNRHKHLTTLAAIAQIIQSYKFEKRLEQAATPEKLRDLLLLAKRRREKQTQQHIS